jgi:hypothetical protein
MRKISTITILLALFFMACKDKSSNETGENTSSSKSEIKEVPKTNEESFVDIPALETDKLNQIIAEKKTECRRRNNNGFSS